MLPGTHKSWTLTPHEQYFDEPSYHGLGFCAPVDLEPFIGQDIEAKVIELDRNRNNVVLSRRAYLEEEQAEQRTAFLDGLAEGEVREGVVSSVVNFGAFVDLGGMDGLVHVSELSWQHVNHPSEVVKVGDKVGVKVLEVDRDRERISLSIRQTLEDPWVVFARDHEVGKVVEGKVIKTVPFGAFISIAEGVEGAELFAPISNVLFGGLLVSTLLTLLVIPAIYSMIDDAGGWLKKKLHW